MANGELCAAPGCGKPVLSRRNGYCSMHAARLRRGGSLEPRQPTKPIFELLGAARFGEWAVIGEGEPYQRTNNKGQGRQRTAVCRCSCGTIRTVIVQTLKSGISTSCGCVRDAATARRNETHGMSKTPEYRIWSKMRGRCTDLGDPDYGGRGIRVCERWETFELFLEDMGHRPSPQHSIERADVNGNYEPSNCHWATQIEQAGNKRTTFWVNYEGEKLALSEACRRIGLSRHRYKVVHRRMFKRGMAFEEAVIF